MRVFVEFIVALLILEKSKADIPNCDYYDTVPLSDDQRFGNGSYLFKGLLIPAHLTGHYNFRVMPNNSKESVKNHRRGCACQLRQCINFCCNYNRHSKEDKCRETLEKEISRIHFYMNVTFKNGSVARLHFPSDLIGQTDLPNSGMDTFLSYNEFDGFTMFENGTILDHIDDNLYDKGEYCITSDELDIAQFSFIDQLSDFYSEYSIFTLIFFCSMVCFILTIGVYFYLNLVHNHHGKCFVCYLLCVFTTNLFWFLSRVIYQKLQFITISGYARYLFDVALNIWLVIISLELRIAFRMENSTNPRFLVSSAFAWIIPVVPTLIVYLLDHTIDPEYGNEKWLPRLNVGVGCWFNGKEWSSLIYYNGPMLGMHIFIFTMFIQTTLRILAVKRDIKNLTDSRDRQQRLESANQTYFQLLRIFVIMGLPWLSYLLFFVFPNENLDWLSYVLGARGIIIFVLFVLKRSTLRLFSRRCRR
ncbi:hypothetical protein KR009_003029 [Drosophila setifemur]|nr:hypothetical protein KR009_003029 [Drosophila setifemur]